MSQKVSYHAISQENISEFNREMKEYVNEGYVPIGGLSVAMVYTPDDNYAVVRCYSIMLFKVIEEK